MNIETRLAKLEKAGGINELCDWCAYWQERERLVKESLLAQGCILHQPKPQDVRFERCNDCGHLSRRDGTFLPAEERAGYAQLDAEEKAADIAECEPSRAWWAHALRLFDREQAGYRAYYGAAFDKAMADAGLIHVRGFIAEKVEQAAP